MKHFFISMFLLSSMGLFGLSSVGPVTTISIGGGNSTPQITVSPVGHAVAIWTNGFPNTIETSFFNANTGIWTTPLILAEGSFPQIGGDQSGSAIAVWVDTATNQIAASHFDISTLSWSAPVLISSVGLNSTPQVSVNASGRAAAVWVQSFPFQVLSASFDPVTKVWSVPSQLSVNTGFAPQVGLDNSQLGLGVWQNFTTGGIEALRISVP